MERVYDIGEHKGNVVGQGFVEDGGQGREYIVGTDSHAWDSAIGKDDNRSDGVDVHIDLSRDTLFVELVLLDATGVGQARRVEDADLGKRLRLLTTFTNAGTYHHAVVASKLVKARRVGLALVIRTTLLVGMIENVEAVMINAVAGKNIGDEFQDGGFSDTSLSNKKDGVGRSRLILRYIDGPLLKGLDVARKDGQSYRVENVVATYLVSSL